MLKLVKDPTQEISCTLLPGKYIDSGKVPSLYNEVYSYWKRTWTEFFEKAGSPPGSLNIENFMRHSFIITLHKGEKEIVGTLPASMFNLSALTTYDHSVVKPFPKDVLDTLKNTGEGRCITGEYLSVNPDYRKDSLGISMADVMIGVLMKIFLDLKIDMALAATVRAAKVDSICKNYGYTEVGSYLKIGVDCIMLYNTQATLRPHPDSGVMAMVERCWQSRRDETGLTISPKQKNIHKAA